MQGASRRAQVKVRSALIGRSRSLVRSLASCLSRLVSGFFVVARRCRDSRVCQAAHNRSDVKVCASIQLAACKQASEAALRSKERNQIIEPPASAQNSLSAHARGHYFASAVAAAAAVAAISYKSNSRARKRESNYLRIGSLPMRVCGALFRAPRSSADRRKSHSRISSASARASISVRRVKVLLHVVGRLSCALVLATVIIIKNNFKFVRLRRLRCARASSWLARQTRQGKRFALVASCEITRTR